MASAKLANVTNFLRSSGQKFITSPQTQTYSTQIKRWLYLYPHMSVGVTLGTLGLAIPIGMYMYDSSKESDSLGSSGRLQHWEKRAADDTLDWKQTQLDTLDRIKDETVRAQVEEVLRTHPRFNPQH